MRSSASRIVRTASHCPGVSPASARCASTRPRFARGTALPIPAFIAAITLRSAFNVRSVTNARSEPRSDASTRWPSRTIHATASRTAPSECAPGEWASAAASSSCAANTGWRSSSCAMARPTISIADGDAAISAGSRVRTAGAAPSPDAEGARPTPRRIAACTGSALRLRVAKLPFCIDEEVRSRPRSSTQATISRRRVENASLSARP